jgi:hypothetical protein
VTHVVLIGAKANSWAWGLEQIRNLSSGHDDLVAIDFGFEGSGKGNKRNQFQSEFMTQHNVTWVRVSEFITKSLKREVNQKVQYHLTKMQNLDEWVTYEADRLPLGQILMSNYARTVGTRTFPLNLLTKGMQFKVSQQAIMAFTIYQNINIPHDKISLANGRSPIEAAVLCAARNNGIETQILERGATTRQMFVYPTSSHYPPDWWEMLEKVSKEVPQFELNEVSNRYWQKRLSGWDELSGRNWGEEFESGKLPKELPIKFVSFFCTSEHEVPALPSFECTNLGFSSQQKAAKLVAHTCKKLNLPLVIKRHPNSIASDGVDRESESWDWAKSLTGVTYIDAKSRVDTYALLRKTSAVVTFKSSVGVEATALGIPARAMGPAEWAFRKETRIWTESEVEEFLQNPTELVNNEEKFWGYLASTFGSPLKVFSDITGGYAELNGERFYSSDYYRPFIFRLLERVKRKLIGLKASSKRALKGKRSHES